MVRIQAWRIDGGPGQGSLVLLRSNLVPGFSPTRPKELGRVGENPGNEVGSVFNPRLSETVKINVSMLKLRS